MKMITHIIRVVLILAVCQLPALISTPFVDPNMAWYHTLIRPPFAPPDAIFGIMWGILYLLLGISAVLVFHRGVDQTRHFAAWLLGVQLFLNACWTPAFFGLHNIALALAVVALMLAEGFFMHRAFAKHSRMAAVLLWPYWLWLGFATYLTAGFMMLN